jgi:hypothetical protein
VEGPQSADWKKHASFTGVVGTGGGGRETGLVVKEDLALPIVRLNPENRVGKE